MTAERMSVFAPCLAQVFTAPDTNIGQAFLPRDAGATALSYEHLWVGKKLNFDFMALREARGVALMLDMHETGHKGFLRSKLYGPDNALIDLADIPLISVVSLHYTVLHRLLHLNEGKVYTINIEIFEDTSDGISVCGHTVDPASIDVQPVWIESTPQRWFVPDRDNRRPGPFKSIVVRSDPLASDPIFSNLFAETPDIVLANDALRERKSLIQADVVAFDFASNSLDRYFDQLIFELHRYGVVTVGIARNADKERQFQRCHYRIDLIPNDRKQRTTLYDNIRGDDLGAVSVQELANQVADARRRRHPAITLILLKSLEDTWSNIEQNLRDLAVDVRTVAGPTPTDSVCAALESATSELVVLLLTSDIEDVEQLLRMFVFEHWNPDVDACFGGIFVSGGLSTGSQAKDTRCLCVRGALARNELVRALRSYPNDHAGAARAFSDGLSRIGLRQRTLPEYRVEAKEVTRHNSTLALPKRMMRWLGTSGSSTAARFSRGKRFKRNTAQRSRLRILTYRWHVPHQVELMRLPADFTLAYGFPLNITERWSYDQRPLPENVRFAHYSEIDSRDYDLAIVHFDENVLCPELSNGVLHDGWGEPFKWLVSLDHVPKIGVCHGTPPFKGQYGVVPADVADLQVDETQRLKLVEVLDAAKVVVVCNSFQAKEEWAFANARTIWHGFDPAEFRPQPSVHDILASPLDKVRPHYRGLAKQREILEKLDSEVDVIHKLRRAPLELNDTPSFSWRQFWYYAKQIASFRLYLNTTLRSPMPRSRGEAMMAGVVPVSLGNHDVDMFIDNGVDGFYSEDTSAIATFINDAFRDPRILETMGAAARRKAIEVFHTDRFKSDWLQLIKDTIGWMPAARLDP